MLVLGITGGVATGKSTVTRMFADLGAPAISADALAHDLLAPGADTTRAVLAAFPDCALPGDDPAINRPALGRRIFADPDARRRLESLTHPAIIAALTAQVAEWHHQSGTGLAAAEIPLLFEAGLEALTDHIVVVSCAAETQVARLRERLGGDETEARRVAAAQWPLAQKVARAHTVITTDVGLEDTRRQVMALWEALRKG
ncbi:MAG: dephospho-CoA kinase [Armatimonadetes bacterium]|nr:dephospho-CoA kinase [Armatimonadota bacterium]